jgi:hypothetical protein
VVAIAALLGFIAVGGAVTFFGRPEPTVVESGVAPDPAAQAAAAPTDPRGAGSDDESPTAEADEPKSPSQLAVAAADAGAAAAVDEKRRAVRAPSRPRVVSPRVARPGAPPAAAPAAKPGVKPEPKPEGKSDPGVDLSNPYR